MLGSHLRRAGRATAAPLPRVLKPSACLLSAEQRSFSLICQALGCEFRPAGVVALFSAAGRNRESRAERPPAGPPKESRRKALTVTICACL